MSLAISGVKRDVLASGRIAEYCSCSLKENWDFSRRYFRWSLMGMTFQCCLILRGMICQNNSAWKSFLAHAHRFTGCHVFSLVQCGNRANLGHRRRQQGAGKGKTEWYRIPFLILCWPITFSSLPRLGLQQGHLHWAEHEFIKPAPQEAWQRWLLWKPCLH